MLNGAWVKRGSRDGDFVCVQETSWKAISGCKSMISSVYEKMMVWVDETSKGMTKFVCLWKTGESSKYW